MLWSIDILLSNAQEKLDIELAKNPNNPELIVLQAMIHTGYIISDPIVNGRKLFGTVTSLYAKAEAIAPQNPRVIFCKAEFAINGAPWTGINPKDICSDVEKSIKLFATFKPESKLSPNWGLDRAENAMKNCK